MKRLPDANPQMLLSMVGQEEDMHEYMYRPHQSRNDNYSEEAADRKSPVRE